VTLKKAGAPAALPDAMPEVPTSIPRDRWDRPLIVPPHGGRPIAYVRASTLGKAIEDTYNLDLWKQRSVALGMSRRTDLVALAAAVPANEGEHRAALDDIAARAHDAAKGNRGADVGAALHKLSERRDAGEDLSYVPSELGVALTVYDRLMEPFEVLASETFVVHDNLESAGSFDRMLRLRTALRIGDQVLPPGTVLCVDLKTGKSDSAKYWGPGYAVQQYVYGTGTPYVHGRGRITWAEVLGADLAPSQDWALLLHVPSDSPDDAGLVAVDLNLAGHLAELCVEVRKARKAAKHAFMPASVEAVNWHAPGDVSAWADKGYPDTTDPSADAPDLSPSDGPGAPSGQSQSVPAQVRKLELIAALRQAPDEAALDLLWQANSDDWPPEATQMVKARLAELDRMAVSS